MNFSRPGLFVLLLVCLLQFVKSLIRESFVLPLRLAVHHVLHLALEESSKDIDMTTLHLQFFSQNIASPSVPVTPVESVDIDCRISYIAKYVSPANDMVWLPVFLKDLILRHMEAFATASFGRNSTGMHMSPVTLYLRQNNNSKYPTFFMIFARDSSIERVPNSLSSPITFNSCPGQIFDFVRSGKVSDYCSRTAQLPEESFLWADWYGRSPIVLAAQFGNMALFSHFLSKIRYGNKRYIVRAGEYEVRCNNRLGIIPISSGLIQERLGKALFDAVKQEQISVVLKMTQNFGVNFAFSLRHGEESVTPLHVAVMLDKVELVAILLSHRSINVNSASSRSSNSERLSPLHYAVSYRSYKAFDLLLSDVRVDVCKFSSNGKTALHLAASMGESELALKLIKRIKFDHKGKTECENFTPEIARPSSPAAAAVEASQTSVIKVFFSEYGVNYIYNDAFAIVHDIIWYSKSSLLNELSSYKMHLNLFSSAARCTPVTLAIRKERLEELNALVEMGANLDTIQIDGEVAQKFSLMEALDFDSISSFKIILLKLKSVISVKLDIQNRDIPFQQNSIDDVVTLDNLHLVTLEVISQHKIVYLDVLLDVFGPYFDFGGGKTFFHLAIVGNSATSVSHLMKKHWKGFKLCSAFFAYQYGTSIYSPGQMPEYEAENQEMPSSLFNSNKSIPAQESQYLTINPIGLASILGRVACIAEIFKLWPEKLRLLMEPCSMGVTPLHLAVDNGKTRMVQYFTEVSPRNPRDLNLFALDSIHNLTPVELAVKKGDVNSIFAFSHYIRARMAFPPRNHTVLKMAIYHNQLQIVEWILSQYPYVDEREQGQLLGLAAQYADEAVFMELIGVRNGLATFNSVVALRMNPFLPDDLGNSALYYACKYNREEIVQTIINLPLNLERIHSHFHNAIHEIMQQELINVIGMLIKRFGVNFKYGTREYTLLHYAVMYEKIDVVEFLATIPGVHSNILSNGYTPMELAIITHNLKIVKLLLDPPFSCTVSLQYQENRIGTVIPSIFMSNRGISSLVFNALISRLKQKVSATLKVRDSVDQDMVCLCDVIDMAASIPLDHIDLVVNVFSIFGPDYTYGPHRYTLLHIACYHGNYRLTIKVLSYIVKGDIASPNKLSKFQRPPQRGKSYSSVPESLCGLTPLGVAIVGNRYTLIKQLWEDYVSYNCHATGGRGMNTIWYNLPHSLCQMFSNFTDGCDRSMYDLAVGANATKVLELFLTTPALGELAKIGRGPSIVKSSRPEASLSAKNGSNCSTLLDSSSSSISSTSSLNNAANNYNDNNNNNNDNSKHHNPSLPRGHQSNLLFTILMFIGVSLVPLILLILYIKKWRNLKNK